jgi:hypothetical protein
VQVLPPGKIFRPAETVQAHPVELSASDPLPQILSALMHFIGYRWLDFKFEEGLAPPCELRCGWFRSQDQSAGFPSRTFSACLSLRPLQSAVSSAHGTAELNLFPVASGAAGHRDHVPANLTYLYRTVFLLHCKDVLHDIHHDGLLVLVKKGANSLKPITMDSDPPLRVTLNSVPRAVLSSILCSPGQQKSQELNMIKSSAFNVGEPRRVSDAD